MDIKANTSLEHSGDPLFLS